MRLSSVAQQIYRDYILGRSSYRRLLLRYPNSSLKSVLFKGAHTVIFKSFSTIKSIIKCHKSKTSKSLKSKIKLTMPLPTILHSQSNHPSFRSHLKYLLLHTPAYYSKAPCTNLEILLTKFFSDFISIIHSFHFLSLFTATL